jgi:hypothetical protein
MKFRIDLGEGMRRLQNELPRDLDADTCRSLRTQGRQGTVLFFLQRVTGGLYVERDENPKHGLRNIQSITFPDADSFKRWCDDDSVRFEHPLLYVQLKREGDELWHTIALPDQR